MSTSFDSILERKLGRKLDKNNAADATASVNVNAKGVSLQGTFIELKSTEVLEPEAIADIYSAASQRLDDILEGIVMGQRWFDKDGSKTIKYEKKTKVQVPTKVAGLRDKSGQYLSGMQLAVILNTTLEKYVKQLMNSGGRLKNQSGRLANSAQVTGIDYVKKMKTQRKARVSIFFNYMVAPYSVFEPGSKGSLGSKSRSPSRLIKTALHLALKDALSKTSFKNNMFNHIYKGIEI
jgi:hypothetical protein